MHPKDADGMANSLVMKDQDLHCLPPTLSVQIVRIVMVYEPRHDKTNKMTVRPAKTQISLGIRTV